MRQVAVRDEHGRWILRPEPKTAHGFRTVPLAPRLVPALMVLAQRSQAPARLLFVGPDGGILRYEWWHRYRWTPTLTLARSRGLDKAITPHSLRHGYLTRLVESAEVGLAPVQQVAGHASPLTTLGIYSHATGRGHDAVRAVMDGLLTP